MSQNRAPKSEVRTTQSSRVFVQFGGALPTVPALFYAQSMNYAVLQGVTIPINGAVTAHWSGDPNVVGEYRQIARTVAPPPLGAFTLHLNEKRGTLNRILKSRCNLSIYLPSGDCSDLSDFLYGWSDKVEIYADAIPGSVNGGNRGEFGAENLIENQLPGTAREIYEIGKLGFGTVGDSVIATEVVDACYGSVQRCPNCGQANDGTLWQYLIQKRIGAGSVTPGNESTVVYSTDGGGTWTALAITGISSSVDATAIATVGSYLVVVVADENAYYYASINQATGVPGAFTKVTTGFVAAKNPNDIFTLSPSEIYFAGNGGYVYKSTDITAGVSPVSAGNGTTSNLQRISGDGGETLVAVGVAGVVLVSVNRGQSWAVTNAAPSANTLQAVQPMDASFWWVGDNAGGVFYTADSGNSWVTKTLSNSPTNITDIVAASPEVIWFAGATVTPTGLLWNSWDGGRDITTSAAAPRMLNIPSTGLQRINRIAVPQVSNSEVSANNVLAVGLGLTTDGIALLGVPVFF